MAYKKQKGGPRMYRSPLENYREPENYRTFEMGKPADKWSSSEKASGFKMKSGSPFLRNFDNDKKDNNFNVGDGKKWVKEGRFDHLIDEGAWSMTDRDERELENLPEWLHIEVVNELENRRKKELGGVKVDLSYPRFAPGSRDRQEYYKENKLAPDYSLYHDEEGNPTVDQSVIDENLGGEIENYEPTQPDPYVVLDPLIAHENEKMAKGDPTLPRPDVEPQQLEPSFLHEVHNAYFDILDEVGGNIKKATDILVDHGIPLEIIKRIQK
jgi:hypothetical protein